MNRLSLDRYIAAVLRHRWLVAVLATLAMLAMTAGAPFVVIKNDHRVLFGEDNPQLAAFDALENTYTASNAALDRGGAAKGHGVHPRGAGRHRGAHRRRVGSAAFQPGRLAYQLQPQRGPRRRVDRRAAGGGRAGPERRGCGARREDRPERPGACRAPGVPRRTGGRAGHQLCPSRGLRPRGDRDHRSSRNPPGQGPGEPSGHRLLPDRHHRHEPRLQRRDAG